jgi:hypothetical protein
MVWRLPTATRPPKQDPCGPHPLHTAAKWQLEMCYAYDINLAIGHIPGPRTNPIVNGTRTSCPVCIYGTSIWRNDTVDRQTYNVHIGPTTKRGPGTLH